MRCRSKKKFTDDGQMHNGGRPITKAYVEPSAKVS